MSLLSLIIFVQFWKPPYREEFALKYHPTSQDDDEEKNTRATVAPEADGNTSGSTSREASGSRDEKVELSHHEQTEQSDRGSAKSSPDIDNVPDPLAITSVDQLEKPTWIETAYAWSPWLLIVVVVIM